MSKKAWIIFVAVCVLLLAGLVFFSSKNSIDVSKVDASKVQSAGTLSGNIADHVYGKADSKVILIEYGDYECPYCGQAYPGIKSVVQKYQNQMAFVFRNFPLTTIHPNALAAAAVAEAAGMQGKYWQMHDTLYDNQSEWANATSSQRSSLFEGYAKNIGLSITTYNADLAKDSINQKISFDQAVGNKAQVTATPTLFLDGVKLDDSTAATQSKLDTAIQNALKQNGIALPPSSY